MSNYTATGTISHIFEERQVSDKFRVQEFAITIADGQYPQTVKFQVTNDKIDLLVPFGTGMEVEVAFNLRGREWEKNGVTNVFNTLDAWKIQAAGAQATAAPAKSANTNPALRATAQPVAVDEDPLGGLPF